MSGEYLGDFVGDETFPIVFDTFDSSGASVTMTGLAVTDIEIYKNGTVTQRSSDSGYTLIDTDGIDIDTQTGIHGFTIDLSDDTDAGFFAAGNDYYVVINSVTIDSQTVRFIAARFSIQNRAPTLAQINAEVLDVFDTDNFAEPATVPAANAPLSDKISFLFTLAKNKTTQTATTFTLRNNADSGNIGTATVSDDGTTATKGSIS